MDTVTSVEQAGSSARPSRFGPIVVLLGLLYANGASIIESPRIPFHPPRTWYVRHLFRMFSLFSHSTPVVYGFEARARLAQPEGYQGREKWILLSPYEFFPQAGGEPNRRLNLHSFARHTPEERARRYAVYQEMVARMKVLHERRFDESIDRIQLYYLEWPKSSDGYFAHVAEATKLLIIDE